MAEKSEFSSSDVPDTELILSEKNAAQLRSNYLGRVSLLRSKVFGKLAEHNAMRGGSGWAIFYAEPFDEFTERNETLLFTYRLQGMQEHHPSLVRIITNEYIRGSDASFYLVQDTTVDHEDDCMYFLDSFQIGSETNDTHGVIFWVDNDVLQVTPNFKSFTPILPLLVEGGDTVTPLGTYTCLEDEIYSLDRASAIVDNVLGLDPVFQIT